MAGLIVIAQSQSAGVLRASAKETNSVKAHYVSAPLMRAPLLIASLLIAPLLKDYG